MLELLLALLVEIGHQKVDLLLRCGDTALHRIALGVLAAEV